MLRMVPLPRYAGEEPAAPRILPRSRGRGTAEGGGGGGFTPNLSLVHHGFRLDLDLVVANEIAGLDHRVRGHHLAEHTAMGA